MESGALQYIWRRQRPEVLRSFVRASAQRVQPHQTRSHHTPQSLSHQLRLNSSMSKNSEKPEEGKEPESSWKDVIYNPRTGEFFGRTARNWGELTQTLCTASVSFMQEVKCAFYRNSHKRRILLQKVFSHKHLNHEDPQGS